MGVLGIENYREEAKGSVGVLGIGNYREESSVMDTLLYTHQDPRNAHLQEWDSMQAVSFNTSASVPASTRP